MALATSLALDRGYLSTGKLWTALDSSGKLPWIQKTIPISGWQWILLTLETRGTTLPYNGLAGDASNTHLCGCASLPFLFQGTHTNWILSPNKLKLLDHTGTLVPLRQPAQPWKDCILRMNGMSRLYDASLAKPWRMGKLLQNFWFLSLYAPLAILGTPHILNHHYGAFLGIVALGFELNRWIFTFQDMASSSHCPARAQFHYCPQPEHSDSTKGLLKYQPIMMASIHQCTSCLVITLPRIHTCLSSFCCQQ